MNTIVVIPQETNSPVVVSAPREVVVAPPPAPELQVVELTPEVVVTTGGIQGAPGEDGDKHYHHVQPTPSAEWDVTHALGKYPAVTVVNSARDEVVGEVHYVDNNRVILRFTAAFSGQAFFN